MLFGSLHQKIFLVSEDCRLSQNSSIPTALHTAVSHTGTLQPLWVVLWQCVLNFLKVYPYCDIESRETSTFEENVLQHCLHQQSNEQNQKENAQGQGGGCLSNKAGLKPKDFELQGSGRQRDRITSRDLVGQTDGPQMQD